MVKPRTTSGCLWLSGDCWPDGDWQAQL